GHLICNESLAKVPVDHGDEANPKATKEPTVE
ncbi:unnamed protein product, partial [marine sediment metagenome]